MRNLRGRLALTYLLVVFLALAAVDLLVLRALETFAIEQRTIAALASTNIAVNLVEPHFRAGQPEPEADGPLTRLARDYARQAASRVLVLDLDGTVVADSRRVDNHVGRTMAHPEVGRALAGAAAGGRRWLEGAGWVLYTAAPVLQNKQPVGVVFLSSSINDLYEDLRGVAATVLVMSGAALLLAAVAGLGVAGTIGRPVAVLTRAVVKMGRGDLTQRVRVRGRDEVATLSAAFNEMAVRLQEEDERRREFLADVAHELQTPVSAIRAMAEPLAAGGPEGREYEASTYRDMAREMETQAERLGRLVGDLLELARLESPRVVLAREAVRLEGLVAGVLRALAAQARAFGVGLEAGNLTPVEVTGDGLRLEQVLINLVGNGIKYAGRGRAVRVDLDRRGGQAVISVTDNGPGIPAADVDLLFERFYRGERSRSRRGGGTGLGLAIAKRIVELHGGVISVRTAEGLGTTFEVRLPVT